MLKITCALSLCICIITSPVSAGSLCDENAEISFGDLESFSVGDIVESYSYYDSEKGVHVIGSPEKGMENAKWKVAEISDIEVRIELIEGEYIPWYEDGVVHKAGEYQSHYETKKEYLRVNPSMNTSELTNISVFKCAG